MTLDFNKSLLDLDDKPVKGPDGNDLNLGKFLAGILSTNIGNANTDSFKIDSAMRIARELHKGKVIEVTDSEAELINDAILQSQAIVSLKSHIIAIIKNTKLSAEKK